VTWRDDVARALDRATFRVVSNETLLDIARLAPSAKAQLAGVKGMPRGILESRSADILAAVERGLAVPEAQLPRFPRVQRWERDPDFDDVVVKLKSVRDAAAARLDLDPGVLCARERLEAVARRRPTAVEELNDVPDLRRWQIAELGPEFIRALADAPSSSRQTARAATGDRASGNNRDESPYKQ
jgi:ribonuclease D